MTRPAWLLSLLLAALGLAACLEMAGYTSLFMRAPQPRTAAARDVQGLAAPVPARVAAAAPSLSPAASARRNAIEKMLQDFASAYLQTLRQVPGKARWNGAQHLVFNPSDSLPIDPIPTA
jgi:hypothetical protein